MESYRIVIPENEGKKAKPKNNSGTTQDLHLYRPWTSTNIKYFIKFLWVHYNRSMSFTEEEDTAGTADPN